jgi:RimJ/RimL family protein N-acetyltransferase
MIEIKNYDEVRHLFGELEAFQPMCTSVLEGVWPGRVWVDDAENPQVSLLITFLSGGGAAWCFLAGDPRNPGVNKAVNKAIFEEKTAGKDVGTFLFTCTPEDWGGQLTVLGDPREPAPLSRRHYVCRELTYNWRANLPDRYTIQPMETDLLKHTDLQLPSEVKTTLGKWMSIKDKRFQDYGFVAMHENQAVAWATVDFVAAGKGDLGFETLPEFRKRGLGSMVAAAALEHGLAMGIEVHWTCAEDNLGSQRSAEKLGLQRERDYVMYLFALDVHTHMAQVAYSRLANGQHRKAVELYEQLFSQKADVPTWAYFDTAQGCAALGDTEKALRYLKIAVKQGWSAVELTEQTAEFEILHAMPEWEALLERMRQVERKKSEV